MVAFIKKWRSNAIKMYGKTRGLTKAQRDAVTSKTHGGKTSNPSPKPKKKARKVKRRMAKKKKRRISRTIPLAPVIGIVGTFATAKHPWAAPGDTFVHKLVEGNWGGALEDVPGAFLGIDADGKIHPDTIFNTWSPLFLGFGIHWLAGLLGVNRVLGRAKIPLIRV